MPIVHIEETSLTHNQPQAKLDALPKPWKVVDDAKYVGIKKIKDKNKITGVALPPQKIRSFVITYHQADEEPPKAEEKPSHSNSGIVKKSIEIKRVGGRNLTVPVVKGVHPAVPKTHTVKVNGKKDE